MPSPSEQHGERVAFDSFEVEMTSGELFKKGRKIRLAKQPADLLVLLARRRGTLVSREELRSALWPDDTFVDFDLGLNNCIRKIREALGDSAELPRFIETVPKKGYRFIPKTRLLISPQGALIPQSPMAQELLIAMEEAVPEPVVSFVAERTKRQRAAVRWVSLTGLAAVLLVSTFPLLRKFRPRVDPASHHVTSHVHGLTLSRDGKLIGYIAAKGELPHIWVRQTSGEKAIQITNGPQPDMAPDLSATEHGSLLFPEGEREAFMLSRVLAASLS